MKHLILMRHAKSDWSHPGLRDIERPLNARGEKSAVALGRWLKGLGIIPDACLCSAATRTRQTLDGLGFDDVPTTFTRDLYHAAPDEMRALLRQARGDVVLMLGHNPGIAEFAGMLVGTRPQHADFDRYPTGATLIATFPIDEWSGLEKQGGTALHFTVPRDLD